MLPWMLVSIKIIASLIVTTGILLLTVISASAIDFYEI